MSTLSHSLPTWPWPVHSTLTEIAHWSTCKQHVSQITQLRDDNSAPSASSKLTQHVHFQATNKLWVPSYTSCILLSPQCFLVTIGKQKTKVHLAEANHSQEVVSHGMQYITCSTSLSSLVSSSKLTRSRPVRSSLAQNASSCTCQHVVLQSNKSLYSECSQKVYFRVMKVWTVLFLLKSIGFDKTISPKQNDMEAEEGLWISQVHCVYSCNIWWKLTLMHWVRNSY